MQTYKDHNFIPFEKFITKRLKAQSMANSRLAVDDSRLKFNRKWTGRRPKILYKGSPMWFFRPEQCCQHSKLPWNSC